MHMALQGNSIGERPSLLDGSVPGQRGAVVDLLDTIQDWRIHGRRGATPNRALLEGGHRYAHLPQGVGLRPDQADTHAYGFSHRP
jgi:hypothetical protein